MEMRTANPGFPAERLEIDRFRHFDPAEMGIRDNQLVAFNARDTRSRSFNLMRTTLSKRLAQEGARLVGITSATPGAGKTFLSINLAASLACVSEDPVYLVDLDLRMASLAPALGLPVECGIETVLEGLDVNLQELGRRLLDSNLVVFPASRVEQGSAELVSGAAFREFIDRVRKGCDPSIVLFDLPPAFANDDAMLIAEQLDGVIVVADAGRTTKKQMREVVSVLAPTPCLGTILNRYQGGFGDSYGYGYGSDPYSAYYR